MKKLIAGLIFVLTSGVWAQGTPLACQVDKAAGLIWTRGQWQTTNFITEKFILVVVGNTLTKESVAKAIHARTEFIRCETDILQNVQCSDGSGGSLFFSLKLNNGGMSQLMGATGDTNRRDTVSVSIFTCLPY